MKNKRTTGSRTRWTRADARAALAEWEASGLSLAAFGRVQGIDPLRLSRWRKQLSADDGPALGLVPVTSNGLATLRVGAGGLVVETARLRIEVHEYDAAAADWVARLVRATEGSA